MRPKILTDDDLAAGVDMQRIIAAIETALQAKAAGTLVAPPRLNVPFDRAGKLVFTVGGTMAGNRVAGFRAYQTFADIRPDQNVTALWDQATGQLIGLVIGELLGALRTGAIGGVAIKLLADPKADTVAMIGTGLQPRTQLQATAAVRPLREVRVFSRTPARRDGFAAEMARTLGVPVRPCATAEDAVRDAPIVICATDSAEPVIRADWLAPGAHVTTLGPKFRDRHEIGLDLVERATLIATDSPAQLTAYAEPHLLEGTPHLARVIDLADIAAGLRPGRQAPADLTLFCSVGLAGTEVLVAERLLRPQGSRHICPVCGFDELTKPAHDSKGLGSQGVCPSCGFQFNVSDTKQGWSFTDWREQWVAKGMPWFSTTVKPPRRWSAKNQLGRLRKLT